MSRTIENNHRNRIHKWISRILFATFFLLIILNLPALCQGHGHVHDEPPSFKYSKEAQEIHSQKKHSHDYDHQNIQHKHETEDGHVHNEEPLLPERSYYDTVLAAVGSTLFISAAPFFILFLLPIDNSKEREPQLKILLSFASGGLLGDAFLHLIPHALVPPSHGSHGHGDSASHSHSHSANHSEGEHDHSHNMSVGICILLGIVVFLMVEKIVRIIKTDNGHLHSHAVSKTNDKKNKDGKQQKKNTNDSQTAVVEKHQGDIKVTGYMNLAADFLHNFTDGLAIGASYLANNNIGYITTFTIFCHEIPHEIGDYAILIQSGYSARKAMLLQLSTALGALLGTYVSFVAEGMGDFATMWILPFTAGGFIYIATVSIIPDLLTDTKFWQSVKEIIALVVGVGMMVLIAKYE